MYREEARELFEDYQESIADGKGEKALEQNRLLYNEIFIAHENANGDKKVFRNGLDKLKKDATFILEFIKLNPRRKS